MKKIILIPDSFKGTMSSAKICAILAGQISDIFPGCETVSIPVADGGEGSVDCFLAALGGEKRLVTVKGPYLEEMEAFYGMLPDGTAVVEMAACAGLPLVEDRKDPEKTSTYGVGQLLLRAAEDGAKQIIVGLGGSCTNDAGCGAACAAGVRFYNAQGEEFLPVGGTLGEIARIDASGFSPLLKQIPIRTMCDIDNPLYGESGAAAVFAPQKGADSAAVARLDCGLRHFAAQVREHLGIALDTLPGGGAAGGMGAGMSAFFASPLQMGIDTVLETVHFDELLQGADLVFTGEGRLDTQSLRGKVVIGVARRAKLQNVPVIALVGQAEDDIDAAYGEGVTAVFTINRKAQDFSVSRFHSEKNLALTAKNILYLLNR